MTEENGAEDNTKPERRKPDWWRLKPAITVASALKGRKVGSRSRVTLHHVVETTVEINHLQDQAVDEARLRMEHKLGEVVDDYEFVEKNVNEIKPLYDDQFAGKKLIQREI